MSTYVTLNRTGDKMPLAGFGTCRISVEDTEEVVYNAIKTGYRLIDGALLYNNEDQVGKGVRRAIDEGIVKREDLFIVGKLWNHYHSKKHVRTAFDRTYKSYGLDYLDLYLCHFSVATEYVPIEDGKAITFFNDKNEFNLERSPMHECWAEMEKLVDAGLVHNIGISNFNVQSIVDLLTYCKYRPAVLEIEHHPYLQQKRLVDWVKSQDIHVIAYASFGPAVYKVVPKNVAHLKSLFSHPVIDKISKKHNRGPAEVLLRWGVQREIVVIPKTVNVNRMKSNLDLFSFNLDEQDMEEIAAMDVKGRFNEVCEESLNFGVPIFD